MKIVSRRELLKLEDVLYAPIERNIIHSLRIKREARGPNDWFVQHLDCLSDDDDFWDNGECNLDLNCVIAANEFNNEFVVYGKHDLCELIKTLKDLEEKLLDKDLVGE